MSQEPEVQQKKIAHAEAPQEQSASQLVSATLGASASEDATDNASTPLDASQQNSQARVAMPGQADTEPASRAGSIAAGSKIGQQAQVSAAGQPTPGADVAAAQLVSAAPDISSGHQAEPSAPAEQATTASDTVDLDTGPSVSSTSGDQQRPQSACQPAESIHIDSLDDADKSSTVLTLQAEPVDQQQQQVSTAEPPTPMLQSPVTLAESTAPDTDTVLHLQQKQQQQQHQSSLAEQPEATVEPAAAKAKQANGGLAVQRQQASIDELTASAPAVGDKSAMAGSPADAQSRASSATAGASAAADAAPSGHGCQIRVNQIYAGFIAVFICRQYFAVACSLFCPVHMPANHNLLCLGNMHRLIIPKPVSNRVLRAVTQVKRRAFQEKGMRIP